MRRLLLSLTRDGRLDDEGFGSKFLDLLKMNLQNADTTVSLWKNYPLCVLYDVLSKDDATSITKMYENYALDIISSSSICLKIPVFKNKCESNYEIASYVSFDPTRFSNDAVVFDISVNADVLKNHKRVSRCLEDANATKLLKNIPYYRYELNCDSKNSCKRCNFKPKPRNRSFERDDVKEFLDEPPAFYDDAFRGDAPSDDFSEDDFSIPFMFDVVLKSDRLESKTKTNKKDEIDENKTSGNFMLREYDDAKYRLLVNSRLGSTYSNKEVERIFEYDRAASTKMVFDARTLSKYFGRLILLRDLERASKDALKERDSKIESDFSSIPALKGSDTLVDYDMTFHAALYDLRGCKNAFENFKKKYESGYESCGRTTLKRYKPVVQNVVPLYRKSRVNCKTRRGTTMTKSQCDDVRRVVSDNDHHGDIHGSSGHFRTHCVRDLFFPQKRCSFPEPVWCVHDSTANRSYEMRLGSEELARCTDVLSIDLRRMIGEFLKGALYHVSSISCREDELSYHAGACGEREDGRTERVIRKIHDLSRAILDRGDSKRDPGLRYNDKISKQTLYKKRKMEQLLTTNAVVATDVFHASYVYPAYVAFKMMAIVLKAFDDGPDGFLDPQLNWMDDKWLSKDDRANCDAWMMRCHQIGLRFDAFVGILKTICHVDFSVSRLEKIMSSPSNDDDRIEGETDALTHFVVFSSLMRRILEVVQTFVSFKNMHDTTYNSLRKVYSFYDDILKPKAFENTKISGYFRTPTDEDGDVTMDDRAVVVNRAEVTTADDDRFERSKDNVRKHFKKFWVSNVDIDISFDSFCSNNFAGLIYRTTVGGIRTHWMPKVLDCEKMNTARFFHSITDGTSHFWNSEKFETRDRQTDFGHVSNHFSNGEPFALRRSESIPVFEINEHRATLYDTFGCCHHLRLCDRHAFDRMDREDEMELRRAHEMLYDEVKDLSDDASSSSCVHPDVKRLLKHEIKFGGIPSHMTYDASLHDAQTILGLNNPFDVDRDVWYHIASDGLCVTDRLFGSGCVPFSADDSPLDDETDDNYVKNGNVYKNYVEKCDFENIAKSADVSRSKKILNGLSDCFMLFSYDNRAIYRDYHVNLKRLFGVASFCNPRRAGSSFFETLSSELSSAKRSNTTQHAPLVRDSIWISNFSQYDALCEKLKNMPYQESERLFLNDTEIPCDVVAFFDIVDRYFEKKKYKRMGPTESDCSKFKRTFFDAFVIHCIENRKDARHFSSLSETELLGAMRYAKYALASSDTVAMTVSVLAMNAIQNLQTESRRCEHDSADQVDVHGFAYFREKISDILSRMATEHVVKNKMCERYLDGVSHFAVNYETTSNGLKTMRDIELFECDSDERFAPRSDRDRYAIRTTYHVDYYDGVFQLFSKLDEGGPFKYMSKNDMFFDFGRDASTSCQHYWTFERKHRYFGCGCSYCLMLCGYIAICFGGFLKCKITIEKLKDDEESIAKSDWRTTIFLNRASDRGGSILKLLSCASSDVVPIYMNASGTRERLDVSFLKRITESNFLKSKKIDKYVRLTNVSSYDFKNDADAINGCQKPPSHNGISNVVVYDNHYRFICDALFTHRVMQNMDRSASFGRIEPEWCVVAKRFVVGEDRVFVRFSENVVRPTPHFWSSSNGDMSSRDVEGSFESRVCDFYDSISLSRQRCRRIAKRVSKDVLHLIKTLFDGNEMNYHRIENIEESFSNLISVKKLVNAFYHLLSEYNVVSQNDRGDSSDDTVRDNRGDNDSKKRKIKEESSSEDNDKKERIGSDGTQSHASVLPHFVDSCRSDDDDDRETKTSATGKRAKIRTKTLEETKNVYVYNYFQLLYRVYIGLSSHLEYFLEDDFFSDERYVLNDVFLRTSVKLKICSVLLCVDRKESSLFGVLPRNGMSDAGDARLLHGLSNVVFEKDRTDFEWIDCCATNDDVEEPPGVVVLNRSSDVYADGERLFEQLSHYLGLLDEESGDENYRPTVSSNEDCRCNIDTQIDVWSTKFRKRDYTETKLLDCFYVVCNVSYRNLLRACRNQSSNDHKRQRVDEACQPRHYRLKHYSLLMKTRIINDDVHKIWKNERSFLY